MSKPASRAAATSAVTAAGVASPGRGAVGATLTPLANSGSPLTCSTQRRSATERIPIRQSRRSWVSPSITSSQLSSLSGWPPRLCGHQSCGSGTSTVHSTRFSPAAVGWTSSCTRPPTVVRSTASPPPGWSNTQRSASLAPEGPAEAHTALKCRIAELPVSVTTTGPQMPPGLPPLTTAAAPQSSGSV